MSQTHVHGNLLAVKLPAGNFWKTDLEMPREIAFGAGGQGAAHG